MFNKVKVFKSPLILFLILFFVSEAIYKYLKIIGLYELRISGFVKFISQIIMCYYILKNFKKNRESIVLIAFLIVSFFIFQIGNFSIHMFLINVEIFNKYIFIIIIFLFFKSIPIEENKMIFQVFERLILLSVLLIFIGAIFHVDFFRTYFSNGKRFGYSGLLSKQSTVKYFFMIAIIFYIYNRRFNYKSLLTLFLIIFAGILTGTKAVLLLLILLIPYLSFYLTLKYRKLFLFSLMILGSMMIFYFDTTVKTIFSASPVFLEVYNNDGIFTALSSYRNELFFEHFITVLKNNWNLIDFLFGSRGHTIDYFRTGFAFADMILIFGIFGAIIYIILYYKNILSFKFNYKNGYLIIVFFLVISISGNFFPNASVAIYMLILNLKFNEPCNIKQ